MKLIKHEIPECRQINSPSGRTYETPGGKIYPSVSTILGAVPNMHLAAWREEVGEEIAARISRKAADRGTKIHAACEGYLLGNKYEWNSIEHIEREMFLNMIPHIQFDELHGLEQRLWSDKLRAAGTVDCVAMKDSVLSIVDFKTSGRYKNRSEIDSYFHQTAAYALMWWERTGMMATNLQIIMTTQDDGVLVFNEPVKKWLAEFVEIRKILP